ncbi:VCBS repeat-containing protein [Isoptericola sp. NPDC019482]|uniref:VCBS repeat-containing protein n=1 Tax=Isoptericola sp. NPDC019482 TaxID=3154688 RepID=UPI0034773B18
MRTHHTPTAARLASALVATGLVLAVAPQALATDDDGVLTLTDAQADRLAEDMGVDVSAGADDAAAPDDGTAGAAVQDGTDPTTRVTFTKKSAVEGVRGLGATVPAAGQKYFSVHALGNVQLHAPDGTTLWERDNASLYAGWGITPLRPWDKETYPTRVVMGYDAVSPFSPTSDSGYDEGDLTGDGVPDLVFSASVGMNPGVGVKIPGTTMTAGTVVTVLDGTTGATAWSKVYSYAAMVKVTGGTLLVANAPRSNQYAPASETATLTGIRFAAGGDGTITPSSTWTYDTGQTGDVSWGAVEDLGDGRVAASWNQRKTDTVTPHGTTVALDVADGSVAWQQGSGLYGRQLHVDAARGRVVALEQADVSDAVTYEVVSYDLADGEQSVLSTRVNALPTAMTIGDAATGGGAEYVISESTLDANLFVNASTIRVLSGKDGAEVQWTASIKRDPANDHHGPSVWGLDVAGGLVLATSQDDRDITTADNVSGLRYGMLSAYTGTGKLKWRQQGTDASPMLQEAYSKGGTDYVRVIDQAQNVRTYRVGNGKAADLTPLQGDLYDGATVDLDADGKDDVVAAGSSHGVWAWKGTSLVEGAPKELWHATVAGEVHDVTTGDVNGDGRPEVVVAADTATVVLDGATGTVLTTIDGAGAYVRSVTVDDLDGDGKDEVVVPTDAVRAYDARGRVRWTYAAPTDRTDVVFGDVQVDRGAVYAQYTTEGAFTDDAPVVGAVALDGATGEARWHVAPEAPARAVDGTLHGALLDHGVFASPLVPYADGHGVAFTWIALTDPTTAGDATTASPSVTVEIRDGRTGELVLQDSTKSSPWSFGHFFVDDEGGPLYSISNGVFRGYPGDDGQITQSSTLAPLRSAQFITGPAGRKLVVGGTEAGVSAYDPSQLTNGGLWQSSIGSAVAMGGRAYLAADLDADGVDDVLSLNFDRLGVNRTAELLGGGILSLDDAIHQLTAYTLS